MEGQVQEQLGQSLLPARPKPPTRLFIVVAAEKKENYI